ncbi:hypothetical protein FRB99_006560 [Tulasnella sp. 403]|nr:hypothetical protein FRB99_006560 [Tulasnella sp. 403]
MPPVSLPSTFHNSFWTEDYRKGLEVLYAKLQQGIAENEEIVNFVKAFRGLQHESVAQGKAHQDLANDLQNQVAEPFEAWAYQHAERVLTSKKDILDGWVTGYETHIKDVNKVREVYLEKCRKADEAEDDAKFAPNENLAPDPDRLNPNRTIRRVPSVAERISQRLREVTSRSRDSSPSRHPPPMASPKNTLDSLAAEKAEAEKRLQGANEDGQSDGTITPKLDKGKGKEVTDSPNAMSPVDAPKQQEVLSVKIPPPVTVTTHIVLGGVSLPASDISALLFRAQNEMAVRTVKFTLLGEYEHCFSGEEFVDWLKVNVEGLHGNLDLATEAAKTLTEEYNALRRVGELGNKFDNSPSAYYQFRPKAFNLQATLQQSAAKQDSIDTLPSPIEKAVGAGIKRSNTMMNYLVKAVQGTSTPAGPDELPHVKARKEANAADVDYRKAVRQLDAHRCTVEENIEEVLKALQRWETERLKSVKTVLLQYQGIIASLHGSLASSHEKSTVLIASFNPESDVKALIENYRCGPFRPEPKMYESVTHETDASFGIDLRKWAGEGAFSPLKSVSSMEEIEAADRRVLPPVLTGMLDALRTRYQTLPDDKERRMVWIYEVPLASIHHLRATLNGLPFDMAVAPTIFEKYDPPVIASTVKLWLLELNPPVTGSDGWDDVKKLYPNVGANLSGDGDAVQANIEEELKNTLLKMPLAGLRVLDAVVSHLKMLVDTTTTDESNDVYTVKLALSMGRSIIRPKQESGLTVQANHAHLFFADLIRHHETVLPPTIERKKRENAQRAMPTRKRTKLVDARQMRRSIDASADPRKLLEAQFILNEEGAAKARAAPVPQPTPAPAPSAHPDAVDEPFVPPGPPPPIASQAGPATTATPASPTRNADMPLSNQPASLHRTTSSESHRVPIRGPRIQARGGPRPISTIGSPGGARPPPSVSSSPPARSGSLRKSSITSSGRAGSPGAESRIGARPRTPPDVKDYLPSKRGGRAAAGSFSRTRPMSPGTSN